MKRAILLTLLLAASVWGQVRKVQYVDPGVVGGTGDGSSWANAYAALTTWEAQNLNLTTLNGGTYLDVYCRATGGTADTGAAFWLNGWTTSATCYINIQMDPNNYHNGIYNASLYRLAPTAYTTDAVIRVISTNVIIDGLQFLKAGSHTGPGIATQPASGTVTIRNCILNGFAGSGLSGISFSLVAGTQIAYNNILSGCQTGLSANANGPAEIYNNTSVNSVANGITILRNAGAAYLIKNNLIYGSVGADYGVSGSTGTLTTATNYTEDNTSPDAGCGSATITFVSASDFHLAPTMSGTLLGTNLSGIFTMDIDNEVRAKWYAGADEILSSSSVNNWWWRRRNN